MDIHTSKKSYNYKKTYVIVKIIMICLVMAMICGCNPINASAAGDKSITVADKNPDGNKMAENNGPDKKTEDSGEKNTGVKNNEEKKEDDGSDYEKTREELEEKEFLTNDDLEKLKISFEKESYAVITYDTILAKVKTNIPEKFMKLKYEISSHYISIDEYNDKPQVEIRGSYEGISRIIVKASVDYYNNNGEYKGCKEIKADAAVKVLDYCEHNLTVGEQFVLEYRNYEEYSGMKYEFDKPQVAVITDDDTVTAAAEGYSRIYLTDGNGKRIYVGAVSVSGTGISISESSVTRAVGSMPYQLTLNNMTQGTVTWSSSNSFVASVDSFGNVTPCSAGEAVITAVYATATGITSTYTCVFTVTSPMLNVTSCNVAKNHSIELTVIGTTGKGVWNSSNNKIVTVYSSGYASRYLDTATGLNPSATVYGNKKGTSDVSVQVDGITLNCTITVTNPTLKESMYIVTKGSKKKLNIKGINAASVIKYVSTDSKVAKVSSDGTIVAKKVGFAAINIEVDNAVITASVNVGTNKAVKAVNNALKVLGAKYSQARRMQKGYYDCSSLVWRSYSPLGMYFGDRGYAPVAANEARYLVSHKKSLPVKYIKKLKKLRTGDLIFYKKKYNGRYKNIYHVAIFMGLEGQGDYVYGKIVHADGSYVSIWNLYNEDNAVVIGRPFP